jgi:lipoprotein-anchoring transpeptidase ErfK/SrfK
MIKYNLRGGMARRPSKSKKGLVFLVALLVVAGTVFVYFLVNTGMSHMKKNSPSNRDSAKLDDKSIKTSSPAVHSAFKTKKANPLPEKKLQELLSEAKSSLAAGKFRAASKKALKVINSGVDEDTPLWSSAANVLSQSNIKIFQSDIPAPQKVLYTVKRGDSLAKIAKKYNTTVEAVQKSNRIAPLDFKILPGQTLCVYKGNWRIVVKKANFALYLYDGKNLFKTYKIGIGRQGRTPEGTFKINIKQKEPDWYYRGKKYPYGSNKNVLGTRWMSLKPVGKTNSNLSGYGIHGTHEPESTGRMSSNGCIRMKNKEVNELYSIVPRGTDVIIKAK